MKKTRESQMTYKVAIQIVMTHAIENVKGTGTGIRRAITDAERERTLKAIEKVWSHLYKREMTSSEKFNMGF